MINKDIGNELLSNGLIVLNNLDIEAWEIFNEIIESKKLFSQNFISCFNIIFDFWMHLITIKFISIWT